MRLADAVQRRYAELYEAALKVVDADIAENGPSSEEPREVRAMMLARLRVEEEVLEALSAIVVMSGQA